MQTKTVQMLNEIKVAHYNCTFVGLGKRQDVRQRAWTSSALLTEHYKGGRSRGRGNKRGAGGGLRGGVAEDKRERLRWNSSSY